MLLARHHLIDHRLHAAIESGRVGQVIEVAAGLSPRGWRFASRYGSRLTYLEADLPATAGAAEGTIVPVRLHTHLTGVGTLELWCVSREDSRRWKLEFNVRERVGNAD